ncbi:MAG: acyl-CoA dehydrogenase family protein [Oscillospiraceae bacterium]
MAEKEIKPHVAECDEKGECPVELFKPSIDMGLHLLEIPEEYGGEGMSFETTAMVFEELAKVDAGYADTIVTNFVALRNVILAGTPEQVRRFADVVVPGNFACFAITEPGVGSDAGPSALPPPATATIISSTAQRHSRQTEHVQVFMSVSSKQTQKRGKKAFPPL